MRAWQCYCGAVNEPAHVFCPKCGAPQESGVVLGSPPAPSSSLVSPPPAPPAAPTPKEQRAQAWQLLSALGCCAIWSLGLGLLALLWLFGSLGKTSLQTDPATAALVIQEWRFERRGYGVVGGQIVGVAKNVTDHPLSYAEVDFSVYDVTGAQVEDAMTNITNLDAHGEWRFSAPVLATTAVTARFKGTESR